MSDNFIRELRKEMIRDLKHDLRLPESRRGGLYSRTNVSSTAELKRRIKELENKINNIG